MTIDVYYLDDEEKLCEIFYEFFHSPSVNVTTFTDAELAIAVCNTKRPDLFFIDYRLPVTNGDRVAQSVPQDIPKILVTGEITVNTEYQFDHVVSKPYEFGVMQSLIDAYDK